eukprot:CAMPEP_0182618920 /NCGR_PEP_ID=MMETSP1330-20130603/45842_1 /TAXON_ID=464278 /ORGANISM="Picochlorum sp., Strain RCC944" /LENGTH=271 /DNA_ID=CAMNT_0024839153 /DNA_START=72 /DNA_END=887 /DNA_ORIENTATION=+
MGDFSEILLTTETILKKYAHYEEDVERKQSKRKKSGDLFTDKYFGIHDRCQEVQLRGAANNDEKNRALRAALNAELRKEKALLQEEVNELYKMIPKKGLSAEQLDERRAQYEEVQGEVDKIDDGLGSVARSPVARSLTTPSPGGGRSGTVRELKGSLTYDGAYQHTDESKAFVKEAAIAQERQDLQLESIERGVNTLKELGMAMGDEVERHDGVIDEIETKMDVVTREIQSNNMKLKVVLTQVRSSRKFFIDLILICILLAVGLYIYNMFS